jgi:hypothetical protein
MASTYLSKTLGTATNSKIWTFSTWLKRSGLSSTQHIFSIDNGSDRDAFSFDSDDGLRLYFNSSISPYADLSTIRVLRDTSAFYNLVLTVDTTQATADDRVKLYINGTQYTWDETTIDPALNYDTFNASGNTFRIGRDRTAANYFDGILTHTHFTDGYAYDASTFGETDATTGIWKPKTSPSVTYGTNGFFLKFENSGSMGTDSSPNGNNLTVNGTLTQTVDTPSNVFATLNLLGSTVPPATVAYTLSNGNTTAQYTDGTYTNFTPATLATMSGKWYAECKVSADGSFGGDWPEIGVLYADNIADIQQTNSGVHHTGVFVNTANIVGNGNKYDFGTASTSYFAGFTNNDIISMAMDCDTGKIWFGVNGTWINSGDPANGTGENATATTNKFLTFYSRWYQPSTNTLIKWNFGNGYFGTTAVASAGSNGNGAIFEYDVPTDYYALNTKNINTYG